jgi:hypothetical protein
VTVDRDAWIALFPYRDEAADAIRYLCTSWDALAAAHPATFNSSTKEPDLTEVLGLHLYRTARQEAGLTGRWGFENRGGALHGGVPGQRTRSDIEYFSNRSEGVELELTIEFKRLDAGASTRRKYYGKPGMERFVDGTYSIGRPLALMAGILIDERAACISGLCRALLLADTQLKLGMTAHGGEYLRAPSALFPDSAEFDTEHRRTAAKAPPHGTIRISHLFLGFPALPPKIARKKRRAEIIEAGTA